MADNYKGGADPIFTIMLLAIPVCWIIYGSSGLWATIWIAVIYAAFVLGRGGRASSSEIRLLRSMQALAAAEEDLAKYNKELAEQRARTAEIYRARQKAAAERIEALEEQKRKEYKEEQESKLAAAMDALANQDKISSESGSEVHISTIR